MENIMSLLQVMAVGGGHYEGQEQNIDQSTHVLLKRNQNQIRLRGLMTTVLYTVCSVVEFDLENITRLFHGPSFLTCLRILTDL